MTGDSKNETQPNMPQIFQVLRCYVCSAFQVHQAKKSNKFECKLCGEKQSIKRHYGIGTAKDCRLHVQRLNGIRGEIDGLKETKQDFNSDLEDEIPDPKTKICNYKPTKSKWSDYVEKPESPEPETTETEILEGLTKKQKRFNSKTKFKRPNKSLEQDVENTADANNYSNTWAKQESATSNKYKQEPNPSHTYIDPEPIDTKSQTVKSKTSKKFVSPLSNNSKWTQFVETKDIVGWNDTENWYDDSEADELREMKFIKVATEVSKLKNTLDIQTEDDLDSQHYKAQAVNHNIQKEIQNKMLQEEQKNVSILYKSDHVPLKSAKLEQFVDTGENSGENIVEDGNVQKPELFNLCDDGELDDVLQI